MFLILSIFLGIGNLALAQAATQEEKANPPVLAEPTPVPSAPVVVATVVPATSKNENENFKFFGDFRYRHQLETQAPKQERPLERIQVHFGMNAQVEENLKATLRLMTGSSANSGNQTLGDEKASGMPRRIFGVDLAYFDFNLLPELNIYGGKMPQPFSFAGKNQMILDRDITPEGWGVKYQTSLEKDLNLFIQGGMFWIRENYDNQFGEDKTDNMLNAGQIGLQWKPSDWTVTVGVGAFGFTGLRDSPPTNLTTGGSANGNTLDINGNYPTNFDIEEKFIEIKNKFAGIDTSVFAEFLENIDAEDLNKAQSLGVQVAYKSWVVSAVKQTVEKDVVVGLFTDSDFAGGVTSSRGTVWSIAHKFTKKISLQYTVFKNENAVDVLAQDYDRQHLDLSFIF